MNGSLFSDRDVKIVLYWVVQSYEGAIVCNRNVLFYFHVSNVLYVGWIAGVCFSVNQ